MCVCVCFYTSSLPEIIVYIYTKCTCHWQQTEK